MVDLIAVTSTDSSVGSICWIHKQLKTNLSLTWGLVPLSVGLGWGSSRGFVVWLELLQSSCASHWHGSCTACHACRSAYLEKKRVSKSGYTYILQKQKARKCLDSDFKADLTVPPTAVRIASGAQVSHFLHPGLAKTYAEARPSTSWIIYWEIIPQNVTF